MVDFWDYPDLLESEKAKIGEFYHILKAFFVHLLCFSTLH